MLYYITGTALDINLARALGAKQIRVGADLEGLDEIASILAQDRTSGSPVPAEVAATDREHRQDVDAALRKTADEHGATFRHIHVTT